MSKLYRLVLSFASVALAFVASSAFAVTYGPECLKNAAYPVFANASTDEKLPWPFSVWQPNMNTWAGWAGDIKGDSKKEIAVGAKKVGQVNGYFRWTNGKDFAKGIAMDLSLATADQLGGVEVPKESVVDVTLRRIQGATIKPGRSAKWTFGTQKGVVKADENGLFTIPRLKVTAKPQTLKLVY